MSDLNDLCKDIYYELIEMKCRIVDGQFTIKGWEYEDYENLYNELLQILKPFFDGDYYRFYAKWVYKYHNYRKKTNKKLEIYTVQMENPVEQHNVREQLSVLKHFLYRRTHSNFKKTYEEN